MGLTHLHNDEWWIGPAFQLAYSGVRDALYPLPITESGGWSVSSKVEEVAGFLKSAQLLRTEIAFEST